MQIGLVWSGETTMQPEKNANETKCSKLGGENAIGKTAQKGDDDVTCHRPTVDFWLYFHNHDG